MGLFTMLSCSIVRRSIPNASVEKLLAHRRRLSTVYSGTSNIQNKVELLQLTQEIQEELDRRGYVE